LDQSASPERKVHPVRRPATGGQRPGEHPHA
jgi:hypothetical protein